VKEGEDGESRSKPVCVLSPEASLPIDIDALSCLELEAPMWATSLDHMKGIPA
jgi:hypothetical protein